MIIYNSFNIRSVQMSETDPKKGRHSYAC
jgi:hypothetical protein